MKYLLLVHHNIKGSSIRVPRGNLHVVRLMADDGDVLLVELVESRESHALIGAGKSK